MTLDDCIAYAIQHSGALRRSRIDEQEARKDVTSAALDFLPTVQGQTSVQWSWGRNIDPETNTYNTITTFNNYYNVYASLTLFDGGQLVNQFRQARNARAMAMSETRKAGDDKAIAVMTKFVDAIYNQKSVALAEEKLADSRSLLQKTQRLYELGEKSRPDVVQIESQVAEDDYNLLHQRNQAHLAILALESEINWQESDSIRLVAAPIGRGEAARSITRSSSPGGRNEGTSVSIALATRKAAGLRYAWLIAKAGLLPSVSVGAGISTSYYRNLTNGTLSYGSFRSQFDHNMGEYVYVSLNVPLFVPDRWKTVRKTKAEWLKSLIDLDDTRRQWNDDKAQATADRDGYRLEVAQMEHKVSADSTAYHLSRRKYEEGMLSTFDLHTASQTLLESRIRLLQTQLLLATKERLVGYYEGEPLW